ncbi:TolC family protein [Emticicia sp. 21SJ11W-3]|uniref:TolC family protein n=1 Tax=Emticicia sp. 21SJ11W-3 TaxID=2916755 RepID=UPI00209F5A0B|nr:TolC family protein [Emticicia sp. 21SJ11W-3]UTA67895.1 TolC family protein [Emticicia sp. 21SJ11W-3]
MSFRKFVYLLLFFCWAMGVSAQNRFSLEQCVEYAYKQSFDIRQRLLKIKQTENALRQSKQAVYPNLSGSFSQGLSSGRSIDPFTNDFIQHTISSNSVSFGTNVMLFNGFALKNQILQNSYNLQADEWDMQRGKVELRNRITLAYMQVLMSQELWKINQEQVRSMQLQIDRVKELVKEGNMPHTNLTDLDAQLATAEYEALNMKSNIELARLALAQLMAYPSYSSFEIEPVPFHEKNIIIDEQYLQEVTAALNDQPVIKNADWRLRSSVVGIKIAQAARYPSISLGAGMGTAYSSAAAREYNYFNQLNFNLNQYARLNINIPIYSNGQVKGRINNAIISQQMAETQLSQSRLQLKQEVEQAYLTARIAQEKLTSAQRQLNAQQTAFDSARERFLEGLIHAIELNTFRLNLEKANSNFIQAKYELLFRKMLLDYYR